MGDERRREGFLGRFDARARRENLQAWNPEVYLERLGAPKNSHIWLEAKAFEDKSPSPKPSPLSVLLVSAVKYDALSRIVSISVTGPEKPAPLRSGPPARFRGPGR